MEATRGVVLVSFSLLSFAYPISLFGQQRGDIAGAHSQEAAARYLKSAAYFEAAWETWQSEVACKGKFHVRVFQVESSVRDVLRNLPSVPEDALLQGRGNFVKLSKWLRMSINYDEVLVDAKLPDGSTGVNNTPSVSITDGETDIDFVFDPRDPSPIKFRDFVRVRSRDPGGVLKNTAGKLRHLPTPFNVGSPKLEIFKMPMPQQGAPGEIVFTNVKVDQSHRKLRFRRTDEAGEETHLKELTFDTGGALPQLTRFRQETRRNKTVLFGAYAILEDFVEVGDYKIPQRLTQLLYHDESGPVFIRVWSSEIQKEPPEKKDFVLKVPSDTKIRGLTHLPASVDGYRYLDITALEKDKIYSGDFPVRNIFDPDAAAGPPAALADQGRLWLVILNGAVFVVIVLWIAARKLRARTQRSSP